jgi:hypothetical protein
MSVQRTGTSANQLLPLFSPEESAKIKHRWLYLEIRVVFLLKQCVQRGNSAEIPLQNAIADYQKIDAQLSQDSSCNFLVIDRNLETHLTTLSDLRKEFTVRLNSRLRDIQGTKMQHALEEIIFQCDCLISTLKLKGDVDPGALQEWEKKIDRFAEQFPLTLWKRKFHHFWQSAGPLIHRKAEILSLYIMWQGVLEKETQSLSRWNRIYAALKIKRLLQRDKKLFFYHYFQDKNFAKRVALQLCVGFFQKDPQAMFSTLILEIEKVKSQILKREKGLLATIGRISNVISTLAYLLTENPYYRRAAFFVEHQEKMPLSLHLDPPFRALTTGIVGMGSFASDLMVWRWLGMTHKMVQTISEPLNLTCDSWISLLKPWGWDEKETLHLLPLIDTAAECSTFVAIGGCAFGFSGAILWQATVGYIVARTAVTWVGKAVDLLYTYSHKKGTQAPSYPFMRGVTQMAVFPLATAYLAPYFLKEEPLYSGPIFENYAACISNQKLCREEACKTLGLSTSATRQEIQVAFQALAKQTHPDHHPEREAQFMQLTAAKKVCLQI